MFEQTRQDVRQLQNWIYLWSFLGVTILFCVWTYLRPIPTFSKAEEDIQKIHPVKETVVVLPEEKPVLANVVVQEVEPVAGHEDKVPHTRLEAMIPVKAAQFDDILSSSHTPDPNTLPRIEISYADSQVRKDARDYWKDEGVLYHPKFTDIIVLTEGDARLRPQNIEAYANGRWYRVRRDTEDLLTMRKILKARGLSPQGWSFVTLISPNNAHYIFNKVAVVVQSFKERNGRHDILKIRGRYLKILKGDNDYFPLMLETLYVRDAREIKSYDIRDLDPEKHLTRRYCQS